MKLTKKLLLTGLLQYNYFPAQNKYHEEIPSIFNTKSLTLKIASKINHQDRRKNKNYYGYDHVEYKATKFNNVPRYFGIPHPKAYVDLCFCISGSPNNFL